MITTHKHYDLHALPIASENTAHFAAKLTTSEADMLQKLLIKLRNSMAKDLSNF